MTHCCVWSSCNVSAVTFLARISSWMDPHKFQGHVSHLRQQQHDPAALLFSLVRDSAIFHPWFCSNLTIVYPASCPRGLKALTSGVKRPGREVNYLCPSSAEVKSGGAIPSLPSRLHGVVLNWLSTGTTLPLPYLTLLIYPSIYLSIYLSVYLFICLSVCLWLYIPSLGPGLFFGSVIFPTQSVGLLGRGISPSQVRYLHTGQHKQNKRTQTSMPWVGFEPTIPAFDGRIRFMP
jgi:hypothetical protein